MDGGTIHGVLVGTDPEAFHESGYSIPTPRSAGSLRARSVHADHRRQRHLTISGAILAVRSEARTVASVPILIATSDAFGRNLRGSSSSPALWRRFLMESDVRSPARLPRPVATLLQPKRPFGSPCRTCSDRSRRFLARGVAPRFVCCGERHATRAWRDRPSGQIPRRGHGREWKNQSRRATRSRAWRRVATPLPPPAVSGHIRLTSEATVHASSIVAGGCRTTS